MTAITVRGRIPTVDHEWNETPAPALRLPDLQGRVAVVTGASRGIGRAVVTALVANGVRCFGIAVDEVPPELARQLTAMRCDLHDPAAIEAATATIAAQTPVLDYLVNVAGIDPKYRLAEGTADVWDDIVDLNLRAYYLLIRACLPLLQRGNGRSVVNVSSINYRLGIIGRSMYATSKAGILGLTTGLALELGRDGIRINTVSPGWTFTERQIAEYFATQDRAKHLQSLAERQSLRLKIRPEDIANHILFYLSTVSRASTGHNCVVDGGWLLE